MWVTHTNTQTHIQLLYMETNGRAQCLDTARRAWAYCRVGLALRLHLCALHVACDAAEGATRQWVLGIWHCCATPHFNSLYFFYATFERFMARKKYTNRYKRVLPYPANWFGSFLLFPFPLPSITFAPVSLLSLSLSVCNNRLIDFNGLSVFMFSFLFSSISRSAFLGNKFILHPHKKMCRIPLWTFSLYILWTF